jgi:hypothetical protein
MSQNCIQSESSLPCSQQSSLLLFIPNHNAPLFLSDNQFNFLKNATIWDVTPLCPCKNDVSEERIVSIIRVTKIGELETTLAVFLLTEAIHSPKTSVLTTVTWRKIAEDGIIHCHRHENLILRSLFFYSHLHLDLPSHVFPSGVPNKNLYSFPYMRAIYSAHLISFPLTLSF